MVPNQSQYLNSQLSNLVLENGLPAVLTSFADVIFEIHKKTNKPEIDRVVFFIEQALAEVTEVAAA
ncbi:hypothetical protein PCC6912_40100 [Chlorogloeopsis fritschii PCC 6912]|uniref:Uncharacterized protein n=1 Tax=Chlorogloeopsis fritschii PCC 6912 TaxID=211165 RepID=A0A433N6G9_CHLFR|nr:hypothetical protein [Chlorogloeopsis fritschii]RUR77051.1 hypothetical protein PCC6912_40100 [Chlorogloeopsis fritschii PCC 6912]